MDSQPSFRQFIPATITLLILGCGGLAFLLFYTLPTVWMRWLFFVLWMMTLTGIALPIVFYLHLRFPSEPPVEPGAILRQALWVGVYGATLAWLQLGRVASLGVAIGLAAGLFIIESLVRMRERARWLPPTPSNPPAPDSNTPND